MKAEALHNALGCTCSDRPPLKPVRTLYVVHPKGYNAHVGTCAPVQVLLLCLRVGPDMSERAPGRHTCKPVQRAFLEAA